jgi:hypothetical protein
MTCASGLTAWAPGAGIPSFSLTLRFAILRQGLRTEVRHSPPVTTGLGRRWNLRHASVVGAFLDNTGASNAGSAYVYDIGGATPTVPIATLSNPSPAAEDNFGTAVGSWCASDCRDIRR